MGPAHHCLWQPPGAGPPLVWASGGGAGLFEPRSPKARGRPCPARPAGFLCLSSDNVLVFVLGIAILGVCHYTLTVKGSHLATHGALTESKGWSKIWAHFFVEVSLGGGGGGCWYRVGHLTALGQHAGVHSTHAGMCACVGVCTQVCSMHYSACVCVCCGGWWHLGAENCTRGV